MLNNRLKVGLQRILLLPAANFLLPSKGDALLLAHAETGGPVECACGMNQQLKGQMLELSLRQLRKVVSCRKNQRLFSKRECALRVNSSNAELLDHCEAKLIAIVGAEFEVHGDECPKKVTECHVDGKRGLMAALRCRRGSVSVSRE